MISFPQHMLKKKGFYNVLSPDLYSTLKFKSTSASFTNYGMHIASGIDYLIHAINFISISCDALEKTARLYGERI